MYSASQRPYLHVSTGQLLEADVVYVQSKSEAILHVSTGQLLEADVVYVQCKSDAIPTCITWAVT